LFFDATMLKFFLRNKENHKDENIEYFKHLVSIAHRDGHLDKYEVSLLCKIGEKLGLGTSTIQKLLNTHNPHEILSLPKTDKERFDQLYDVISIMLADEEITEEEIEFCTKLARRLGFKAEIVGELVRNIHYDMETGSDKSIIEKNVNKILKA
jgi:uncharacterized tellurite resistance protein B-like protein